VHQSLRHSVGFRPQNIVGPLQCLSMPCELPALKTSVPPSCISDNDSIMKNRRKSRLERHLARQRCSEVSSGPLQISSSTSASISTSPSGSSFTIALLWFFLAPQRDFLGLCSPFSSMSVVALRLRGVAFLGVASSMAWPDLSSSRSSLSVFLSLSMRWEQARKVRPAGRGVF
jgi:hypothetical protein